MTIPTDVAISRRGKFLVQVHFIDSLYSYLLSCPCDDDNALHLIIHSLTRTCSPPSPVQCPDRLKKILIHPRAVCLLLLPTSVQCCPNQAGLSIKSAGQWYSDNGNWVRVNVTRTRRLYMRCSNEGSAYNYLFTPPSNHHHHIPDRLALPGRSLHIFRGNSIVALLLSPIHHCIRATDHTIRPVMGQQYESTGKCPIRPIHARN